MYSALTRDIRVTVRPEFSPERSEPSDESYFWVYTIEISNQSRKPVKLMHGTGASPTRLGHLETVDGPGVVGEQPTIQPGQAFRYSSGCPLKTPSGFMTGSYDMVDEQGPPLRGRDPGLLLDSPFLRRVLN